MLKFSILHQKVNNYLMCQMQRIYRHWETFTTIPLSEMYLDKAADNYDGGLSALCGRVQALMTSNFS